MSTRNESLSRPRPALTDDLMNHVLAHVKLVFFAHLLCSGSARGLPAKSARHLTISLTVISSVAVIVIVVVARKQSVAACCSCAATVGMSGVNTLVALFDNLLVLAIQQVRLGAQHPGHAHEREQEQEHLNGRLSRVQLLRRVNLFAKEWTV